MLGIYCRTSKDNDLKSTMEQQKEIGIKFARKHDFEYEIYEDRGVSGYKISDDEQDPFKNRPAFADLINDIKKGKIDKVWVWEHSRLSRNNFASAFIFRTFEKHKITLYENQEEYDMEDPTLRLMRQMLDAIAEYERQLIVARTTRGLRKRIDEGKRSYQKLYGYRKEGKNERGYTIWDPVESEMNVIKHVSERYMNGASLRKICSEIRDMNKIDGKKTLSYANLLVKILRRYQYTGWQLTIEGLDTYRKFRNNEIESLKTLLDRKYWVKSYNYPIEITSIENWIKTCERLQMPKGNQLFTRKDGILRASRDIATGIIECGDCGVRFYYKEQKKKITKSDEIPYYRCYFHRTTDKSSLCRQNPRSFKLNHINEIFKIFYFYYLLVFNSKSEQIKNNQRNMEQTRTKLKEKIAEIEKEISLTEKRIAKFKGILCKYDTIKEADIIDVLSSQITRMKIRIEDITAELPKLKIEHEILDDKLNQNELDIAYYEAKDKINDWFYKLNMEDQRNELIRTIEKCKVFNQYLIIDTGNTIFLFDISQYYVFDMTLLDILNKSDIYKTYFAKMKRETDVKKFNGKPVTDIKLDVDDEVKMRVFQYLIKAYKIVYDISEKTNFVSFVPVKKLYEFKLEQFGNEE